MLLFLSLSLLRCTVKTARRSLRIPLNSCKLNSSRGTDPWPLEEAMSLDPTRDHMQPLGPLAQFSLKTFFFTVWYVATLFQDHFCIGRSLKNGSIAVTAVMIIVYHFVTQEPVGGISAVHQCAVAALPLRQAHQPQTLPGDGPLPPWLFEAPATDSQQTVVLFLCRTLCLGRHPVR